MATKRFLTLFWYLAFAAIILGGIALTGPEHSRSLPQMQQKLVQLQYDVSFQLESRLRAQGETSCSGLLGAWLVSMGGLGIAFPLLVGFILCRQQLNRSLSAYPGPKTGHWEIIFKSIRQTYWRLNIFRFEKLVAHLILMGILLFIFQIWWLPFCFQPLNLTGIFLLCYLCGCYIYLLAFYRQFYSLQESVRILETRLGLKQRLTTSLEFVPSPLVGEGQGGGDSRGSSPALLTTVLIAQTAERLAGQKISRLLPHTWTFIPRKVFFYQLASVTLAALMLDWAGPSLVASYYLPRTSEKYTRKAPVQPNPLDKLLTVQAQELNRLSQDLYLKRNSLDPQVLADKLAILADDLEHLATRDTTGYGFQASGYPPHPNPPPQGGREYTPSPLRGDRIASGGRGWGEEDAVGLEPAISRLAKQFLSPVVMNINQPKATSTAARKEWLKQTSRKLKDWQTELKDMLNQADSGQSAKVVLSTSPPPPPQEEKAMVNNNQPKSPVAPQLKEVARQIEGLKITSRQNLPVVAAIKSNLWQQAEQLKEMADKIEKAEKEREEQVDFSQQYRQIAKELSEMSREVKKWDGLMDEFHIQANAGGQLRQQGYLPNTALPVKTERGGTGSNPLADAQIIMGEKGSSNPDTAPKFRVKGESDPHYHPKVTDLTLDEADTSSRPDIGERAAIITRGENQGSSPNQEREKGQERRQGQVLSGEKTASHPGSSPSHANTQLKGLSENPATPGNIPGQTGGGQTGSHNSPDTAMTNSNPQAAGLEQLSQLESLVQAAQDRLKMLKANLGTGTGTASTGDKLQPHAQPGNHAPADKPTGVEELARAAADMETLADQVQWADDSGNAKADMLKNQAGRELKRMAGQLNVLAQKQVRQQNRDQNNRDSDKQFLQEKLNEGEKKLAELSSQISNTAIKLAGENSRPKAEQQAGWFTPSVAQQNQPAGLNKAQSNLQRDQANLDSIAEELSRLAKSIADAKFAQNSKNNRQQTGLVAPSATRQNQDVGLNKAQSNLPDPAVPGFIPDIPSPAVGKGQGGGGGAGDKPPRYRRQGSKSAKNTRKKGTDLISRNFRRWRMK